MIHSVRLSVRLLHGRIHPAQDSFPGLPGSTRTLSGWSKSRITSPHPLLQPHKGSSCEQPSTHLTQPQPALPVGITFSALSRVILT